MSYVIYDKTRLVIMFLIVSLIPSVNAADSAFAIEEIVVTARKREESLQDTPIAISAFGSNELEAASVAGIDEISHMSPGLVFDTTANSAGSPNASSVFLRGIGQVDFTLNAEPGVGIYVDDAYLPHSTGSVIDALDIERVEVLRGPQGTLYGRNTIGGAVRVVSKKPHEEFEGYVETTLGRYDRVDVKGVVNIPLSDTFFTRFSAISQDWDGFVSRPNQAAGDSGDRDRATVVGQARWLATDNFTADLMLTYQRDRSTQSASVFLFNANVGTRPGFVLANSGSLPPVPATCCVDTSDQQIDSWLNAGSMTLHLDWDINDDLNLKSITYYRDLKTEFGRDSDHSPLDYTSVDSRIELQSWSQELQLSGQAFDDRLDWLLGLYYFEEDGFMDDYVSLGFAGLFSGGLNDATSAAVYAQGTYDATDELHLTFGLRYSDEDKTFTVTPDYQFINVLFGNPFNLRLVALGDYKSKYDGVDIYGNIAYDLTDDLMAYASYSEGFKGGGFTQRIPPGVAVLPEHQPEFATVYEIGAKYTGLDGRLQATFAAFHTDYNDMQITVTDVGGIALVTRNAGNADINGIEMDLTFLPVEGLRLRGAFTYMDAEYKKLSPSALTAGLTLDHKLVRVPEWQASGTIDYTFPFWKGTLTPRVDLSYSSDMENDSANPALIKRDSYTMVNASLSFLSSDELWNVTAFLKNASDERFYTSGVQTVDYADVSLNRPREWGIQIRRSF